jgi:uncharacterized protein
VLRTAAVRVLDDRDVPEVLALLDGDPVTNVLVASRVEAFGMDPWRLGAEVWGHVVDGAIRSVCFAGANLVPVATDAAAAEAFAERGRRQGRRCSAIVGPAEAVRGLWEALRPWWGPAREVRDQQPLLATTQVPQVPPDPLVRRVHPEEVDVLLPAAVAMYTEEVGTSPVAGDGGAAYRARLMEMVQAGRAFARIEDGRVVFKAEVGSVSRRACQIQGVWVDPDLRGRGLATGGMSAVVGASLRSFAPVVSLYVNDGNAGARHVYDRVGFRPVGLFMSVLF